MPSAVWVRYVYKHTPRAHAATQRVKLASHVAHHAAGHNHHVSPERLAHITNFIFAQGYLPANVRSCVYWEGICGRRLGESIGVHDLLMSGEGASEDKALRLIIGKILSGVYVCVGY